MTITEPVCPYCGRENEEAYEYIAEIDEMEEELEEVRKVSRRKIDLSSVKAKLIIIALLIVAIMAVNFYRIWCQDYDKQISVAEKKNEKNLSKNEKEYIEILDKLIEDRAYIELNCMKLNNSLMHSDAFSDYYSVFQCTTCYSSIYSDVMKIVEHSNYVYKDTTDEELCKDISIYVRDIVTFSSTDELYYTPERFTPEKSQYMEDIKQEASDMIIVFFGLDKSTDLYSMTEDEVADLLCKNVDYVRRAE